tara:strand:- start:83 stop:256 length:174 start_codon:yes stop_codon:yes gene_type:complete
MLLKDKQDTKLSIEDKVRINMETLAQRLIREALKESEDYKTRKRPLNAYERLMKKVK